MNILYISSEYPPETGYGGIGTYTRHIAEGMVKRGHIVTVITEHFNSSAHFSKLNNVSIFRITRVPYPLPSQRFFYPIRTLITQLFPHTLHRLCWSIAVKNCVIQLIGKSPRFDIIEAPECGAEGVLIPKCTAKIHVIRLHTPWEIVRKLDKLNEALGDHFILPQIERYTAYRANAISAPSTAIGQRISRAWKLPYFTTIPNPIPCTLYHQTSRKRSNWVYTGRIERRKGVHILIIAYLRVCSEYKDVPPLMIIGNTYSTDDSRYHYGDSIQQLVTSSPFGEKIKIVGHITHEHISEYLSISSVAFFPSLWENYPYSCLEAMANGCAVVATNCGGIPEIISNYKNGILTTPNSTQSLYKAMKTILSHPEYVRRLGQAACERVFHIASQEMICEKMERFYQTLLKESS